MGYPAGTYLFRVLGKADRYDGIPETTTRTVKVSVSNRPGSQALPWHPGQTFELGDWRVTLGATDLDAWPELSQHYNDGPPPAGWSYISVPMTFTRTGTTSGNPFWGLDLKFVGSDGVVYGHFATVNGNDYSCYLSDDWTDAPELYPGGTSVASDCMLVPQSALAGGLWRMDDWSDEQFVTLS